MRDLLRKTITPLTSLFLFMLSNGLFNTLATVRMHNEGYTSAEIGILGAAFYAGLFIGSFKIEALILKVGHIRAFAAFAAGLVCVYLCHGLVINFSSWLAFRAISGFCTAGLFIVIESWLLVTSTIEYRGRLLAVYMIVLYLGQALGQFFMNLSSAESLELFAIAAILGSLSILPLSLTKIPNPAINEPSVLNIRKLYQLSASGLIGSFISGTILSAVYVMMPLVIARSEFSEHIAGLMATIIIGGMMMQYPLGRLSDRVERRKVLLALNAATICTALILMGTFDTSALSYAMLFIFGGVIFTIYPISISSACDNLESKDLTAGTQALLLSYSAGAIIGPLLAPIFMLTIGTKGLFVYFIVTSTAMLTFISWRRTVSAAAPPSEDSFVPVVQTSPIINEIDPRTD